MVGPHDPLAELSSGEGLYDLALELVEPGGQRAGHRCRLVEPRGNTGDSYRGVDPAPRLRGVDRVERAVIDMTLVEPT